MIFKTIIRNYIYNNIINLIKENNNLFLNKYIIYIF
jgi:hypothetical protein